jgi:hypothetical protein
MNALVPAFFDNDYSKFWRKKETKYHDGMLHLVTYFTLTDGGYWIDFSGLYKEDIFRAKRRGLYLLPNPENSYAGITRAQAIALFEGAVYPTTDVIHQIFDEYEQTYRHDIMDVEYLASQPKLKLQISDVLEKIPENSNLFVLSCRGFGEISAEDRQARQDSSDDFDIHDNVFMQLTEDDRQELSRSRLRDENDARENAAREAAQIDAAREAARLANGARSRSRGRNSRGSGRSRSRGRNSRGSGRSMSRDRNSRGSGRSRSRDRNSRGRSRFRDNDIRPSSRGINTRHVWDNRNSGINNNTRGGPRDRNRRDRSRSRDRYRSRNK